MIHIETSNIEQSENTAISIGNFDGMHLGHMNLIKKLKEYATPQNLKTVVFSFYPHPRVVLKNEDIRQIFTRQEKKFVIEKQGIDIYIEYPFDVEFAKTSPINFLEDILVKKMKCKVLIIGEDYRFGRQKLGDVDFIKEVAKKLDIEVIVVSHNVYNGSKISSTDIRNCIAEGDVAEAQKMLHSPYFVAGTVITGNKLGRELGFPTANLSLDENKILPPNGVYITTTEICETKQQYNSVTNIGFKPTVNGTQKTVETFLLDFQGDLYTKNIIIYFYERIRAEQKFGSLDLLKSQIAKDVLTATEYKRLKD